MSASAARLRTYAALPINRLARIGLLLVGLLVAFWFNASLVLNPDVSWFYYVAQKLLGGAVLYLDLVEPNAPFASISMIPAALLGRITSLSPFHAILIYVTLLGGLSCWVCARIIDRYGLSRVRAGGLKLALFLGIFFLPVSLFGEREHLFCILAMPYLLTLPLRGIEPADFAFGRCCIGFVAGLAVNLKPPFGLVIVAAESLSLLTDRRRALFRPEQIGLAASAILSIPIYPLVFPRYASDVVPWVVDLYGAFADTPTTIRKAAEWGGAALLMFFAWGRDANPAMERWRRLMLVVTAAWLAIFVIQDKGWDYQIFGASLLVVLLAGAALQAQGARPVGRGAAAACALLLIVRAGAQFEAPDYVESHFPTIRRLILQTPGSFQVLTSAGTPGFPFAVETGHEWASRYGCLMLLPGIVAAEARGEHSRWEAPFRQAVAEDLASFKPPLIFVQTEQLPGLPVHFDVLAWLLRDPRFAALWAQYRPDGTADRYFAVFRRQPEGFQLQGGAPR
jgi:hypothetical protein